MKTLTTNELNDIIGTDGFYSLVLANLKANDTIYVATLPHSTGNCVLGCHLITNSSSEFSYWDNQANKNHRLYRVQKYLYI